MTREEAADLLDNLIGMVEDNQENDYDDALKMGIKALKTDGNTTSRQDAIELIENESRKWGDEYGVSDVLCDLSDMPSAPQWIPVTERLPEKNGDYYVTYEKGYAEGYGFDLVGIAPYDADCEGFGIWQERYDPVSLGYLDSYFVDIKVTAWMPYIRPEPWKGGEA